MRNEKKKALEDAANGEDDEEILAKMAANKAEALQIANSGNGAMTAKFTSGSNVKKGNMNSALE